jgi:hypothetical protein
VGCFNRHTKDNFLKRIHEGFDKCTRKVWSGACKKCNNARISTVTAQWLAGVMLPTSFIITLDDEDDNDNDEEVMVAKGVVPVEEVGPSIDQPSLQSLSSSSSSSQSSNYQVSSSTDNIPMCCDNDGKECLKS